MKHSNLNLPLTAIYARLSKILFFTFITAYVLTCAPLAAQTQIGSDIDGEAPTDLSGQAVACSSDGTVVAIGALQNDGNGGNSGHVRVYAWNGTAWVQRGTDLEGVSGSDVFGSSVALSSDGTIVAIGAPENDGNGVNSGHVRVFVWNGSAWVQRGSAINGEAAGDLSGSAVDLSSDGSILAIGAGQNDGNGSNAGHVRVFAWDGSGWIQRGGDIDGEATLDDFGGRAIALSANGNILAAGARSNDGNGFNVGHARVFEWNGSTWIQRGSDIDGEGESDNFGVSLSLSADGAVLAVGANQNDGAGANAGHTRVFTWSGSTWVQRGSDIDGEAAGDESGIFLSLSADGELLAIGEHRNDANGSNAGQVRLFVWNGSAWAQRGQDILGEAAGDEFGRSLALSAAGGILVVGGPRNDAGNASSDNRGHTRVFSLCPSLSLLSLTNSNMVHATAKIYLEANPDPADIVNYSWTSSNTGIATVSGAPSPLDPQIYGEITGVAPGSATITYSVTLTDGCELSESFEVTVEPLPALQGSILPASQNCGSTVSYTVEVGDSFFDISGMQFSVEWDSEQLEFVSLNAPNINGQPVVTANGTDYLTFAWADDPLATEGVDLPNGTALITAVFKVIDNSTPATISITSNPTAIEATNAAGAACTPTVNAPVNLTVIPVTISPGAISPVCTGSTSAVLPYTMPAAPAPQGNEYTIDFANPAISDVAYTALPASPITLVLPGNLPPGVYTATLKVRLDGDCESTDYPLSITVEPDPTISISGGATVCVGGSVTLTATPGGGTGTCTIQWQSYDGANWNDLAGETNATYTPPTSSVGAVQYRATYSCTGGGCDGAVSGTQTVTVVADPTISISGGATVCVGGPVTLTATPGGGTGTCTIQWQSYDGASWNDLAGETNATYTPPTSSVGAIQYRATYSCTGGGCDGAISGTQTVTVVADPTISISGGATVCVGGPVTLTATPGGGTGTCTIQWQSYDGVNWNDLAGETNATYTPPTSGVGVIQYRATYSCTGGGCDGAVSGTQTVTVVADPTISISGGATVCVGGSVTLTATPGGGTGTCTIQWQSYNGVNWNDLAGETNATYTPPTNSVGVIQYRATYSCTGGGCDGAVSGTQTVTVVADPTISISGGATVCIGGPVTLTATPGGGTGTCTIQWQSYDGANWNDLVGETNAMYTPPTSGVGAIQYRATYSCTGGGCDGAISGTETVTVVADPVLTPPSLSLSSLCPDSSSVISVTASGGTGTFSYQWQYFDGIAWAAVSNNTPAGAVYANASTPSMSISGVDNPGAYPYRCIVMQSGVGCDELTSASATLTVTPCLYFDGLLIWSRDSLSGIANASVALTGAATDSDGPTTSAGGYHLVAPVASGNFTITPNKPWSNANAAARNASLLNGVDVADASRITQHVAASNFFTDPEDLVAADVNRNNLVSTQDAALINQALLGRPLAFLQYNKSWRFIPTGHVLPKNPSGPPLFPTPASFWGFPESRTYTGVDTDQADQHFYGIKIGDVVATNANPAGQRPGGAPMSLIWAASDFDLMQDEEIEAVFSTHGFADLAAVQFAIGFDTTQLEYLSTAVSPGLPFGEGAFGAFTLDEGNIRFAWSSATGASVQNYTSAYRLRFRVRMGGGKLSEALYLDAAALQPVAYSPDLIPAAVRLRFIPDLPARPREDQAGPEAQDAVLYQNRPNPFQDQTTIGFMLARDGEARLRVYDADGRLLFENSAHRAAGYHEIDVALNPARCRGLLYYELRTPERVLSRKMIARSFH